MDLRRSSKLQIQLLQNINLFFEEIMCRFLLYVREQMSSKKVKDIDTPYGSLVTTTMNMKYYILVRNKKEVHATIN